MSDAAKAVFLSYAREDAAAARRIAEALRAHGVEVWFDENELRGGDAWDAKIRRQIKECALFMPVVSAHSQERGEGYFRLEWKVAVERTHLMAEGVPFLAPVVIDETSDAHAIVPAEFLRVQWTRLTGALPSSEFVAQVKRLLDAPRKPLEPGRPRPARRDEGIASPAMSKLRIASVVAIIAAVAAGLAVWKPWSRSAQPAAPAAKAPAAQPPLDFAPAKSIAVLPFANLSDDKDANAFFADGMHDELLAALAKIRDLRIISRMSVLVYRDPGKRNLKQIAAELGVAHILEGSVSRAGNRVRIIVQLIDAATDQHRWAETYNKDVSDVFQVQADISALIAQSLAATLSPEQKVALAHKPTTNPAAYDLYLRARRWREMGVTVLNTVAKIEEVAVHPLEQAVSIDPKFAAAYAELGLVHGYLYWTRERGPGRLAQAKAAIDTALRLDQSLPVAHLALGRYYYIGFLDYARSTEELAIALAAMPGDAEVLYHLAMTQRRQGRWTEATANFERAFAVNPRSADLAWNFVQCLLAQRLYARAERAAEQALAVDSANLRVLTEKANARFARDGDLARFKAAVDAIPLAPDEDPHPRKFRRAFDDGRYAEAVRIYDEAQDVFTRFGSNQVQSRTRYFFALAALADREKVRDRALAAIAAAREPQGEDPYAWYLALNRAMLHAYAGLPDEARRFATRTLELTSVSRDAVSGPEALYRIALVHVVLGDRDRALALLDQAMNVQNLLSANQLLHLEPWWQPLRHDPRFKTALAKAAPRD